MSNSNKLETWGNETNMNMNPIIYQNILASPYFKSLYDKKTYHEIVDEIYNEVYTLGPFMKGTAASTAFCLLFKLWTQRLTVKQVEGLIDHGDSPYIRGVGFLYLRYVCAPKELWDWLGPYIDDDEEITIVGGPKPVNSTIGKLCRLLLTDIKYYGTMLPRIPVPIARDIEKKMADYDRDNKGGRNGSAHKDSYADREPSRSKDDHRRRDDSRGSKHDRDRRRSRSRSRSRSPHRRQRSRHDSRDRRDSHDRHDSRDRRDSHDRHDSRDRRRERPVSPRDEFDDYERRSRRHDEHRGYSRDKYSDRSRDRSRSRSRDRSSRRRSRSRDYDRKRY
ncbi:hypothetical protein INT43_000640 [Umbelopsis isabellina]|uniref:Pre-mRNA-splicing factor 38 n=1 Tax=Mortierella isabellina TaxID=91625 RepID=A0A8H7Q2H3_MORIS|nr:hypothetical protein INT43_000640 [Umbelopsis isabellina]